MNIISNPSSIINTANSVNGHEKTFFELFSGNPLFTGGAGLVGVGVILSYFRRLSIIGKELLKRRFISRVELDNTDMFVFFTFPFGRDGKTKSMGN